MCMDRERCKWIAISLEFWVFIFYKYIEILDYHNLSSPKGLFGLKNSHICFSCWFRQPRLITGQQELTFLNFILHSCLIENFLSTKSSFEWVFSINFLLNSFNFLICDFRMAIGKIYTSILVSVRAGLG